MKQKEKHLTPKIKHEEKEVRTTRSRDKNKPSKWSKTNDLMIKYLKEISLRKEIILLVVWISEFVFISSFISYTYTYNLTFTQIQYKICGKICFWPLTWRKTQQRRTVYYRKLRLDMLQRLEFVNYDSHASKIRNGIKCWSINHFLSPQTAWNDSKARTFLIRVKYECILKQAKRK